MLKIVGSKLGMSVLVTVDPYIPLTIELGNSPPETPLYWRARAGDESLVEVGVSPNDGSLRSITLTQIPAVRVVRSTHARENHISEAGVPLVDMSMWPTERREFAENFVEQVVPIDLILGESTATLSFSPISVPISWQEADNVLFGVAKDGSFCCIEVRGLSAEQLQTIAGAADK